MPSTEPDASVIHVAVGVIEGEDGRILLTRRPEHVHQGGKWEFPGGKLEDGESVEQALARELLEELGICPVQISPLISIPFLYPDKHVLLDVWVVSQFSGLPHAREGQPMSWVARQDLHQLEFPQANRPIIQALNLPERILISPRGLIEAELIDGVRSSLNGSKPGMVSRGPLR